MPDPSVHGRAAMLAYFENSSGMGGIVSSANYKGFSVEIRPSRWRKKIWIGKLETVELAKYVADAVRHYVGMPPFHFEEGFMTLPAITCIGTVIGSPVVLSTQEMRVNYVREIAQGDACKPQRDDFILQVKKVVKNPDFPFRAPSRTELVVLDDDSNRDDEFVFDEDAAKALEMSSHSLASGVSVAVVQTHVAGPDSVGGSEAVPAYVASFDVDSHGFENILRNSEDCINATVYSPDDCPISSSEDEKIWFETIHELDKSWIDVGASTPSLAFNDGEVYRDGDETSPILSIPPIVSDWSPSLFAKRQRIGD